MGVSGRRVPGFQSWKFPEIRRGLAARPWGEVDILKTYLPEVEGTVQLPCNDIPRAELPVTRDWGLYSLSRPEVKQGDFIDL